MEKIKTALFGSPKSKPLVHFGSIEIREYEIILGDNPGCLSGPSLSIGWNYSTLENIPNTVDKYEINRAPRRSPEQFKLTVKEREQILYAVGVTPVEMRKALEDLNVERFQRKKTLRSDIITFDAR